MEITDEVEDGGRGRAPSPSPWATRRCPASTGCPAGRSPIPADGVHRPRRLPAQARRQRAGSWPGQLVAQPRGRRGGPRRARARRPHERPRGRGAHPGHAGRGRPGSAADRRRAGQAAAMAARARAHIAEWRALLDDLQDDPQWAAGPFGWWGVSMGTTHGLPLAVATTGSPPRCWASTPCGRATRVGLPGGGGSPSRCCSSASRDDELMTRETTLALWDALGSGRRRCT